MKTYLLLFSLLIALSAPLRAQENAAPQTQETQEDQKHKKIATNKNSVEPILPGHFASGTSQEPKSGPRWMIHKNLHGNWTMMLHGQGFFAYATATGPRGQEKLFSTNWIMAGFERPLAGGKLTLRSMFSLEPATVTGREYPLLFQTGETAYGVPLVDGQHPHDFFMEQSVMYSHNIRNRATVLIYCALVGDPALGSPVFMHSVAGSEMPEAWLTHHHNNSTHISSSVCTAGFSTNRFMVEASTLHGHEPDERRWKLRPGIPDSWSTRFTLALSKNLLGQFSYGHLHNPETPLEPGDVNRITASVIYNRPFTNGNWAITAAWGMNHHTATGENLHGFALDSNLQFAKRNYILGRIEAAEKNGLLLGSTGVERPIAFTVGFARDLATTSFGSVALGGNVSFYNLSPALRAAYGHPVTARIFLRFRLGSQMRHDTMDHATMDHSHHHMH